MHDVIIAGAGPVGLLLAGDLARAGCSVLVLEKEAEPASPLKHLPFGIRGLSAPSIDALQARGLLDRLEVPKRLQNPFGPGKTKLGGHFAGIPFDGDLVDRSGWAPRDLPASLLSEMAELEAILAQEAEARGATIRRGVPVTAIAQDADGVTVDGHRARWLVGCDGGRSPVRKLAGFAFAGTEPEFTGYSVQLDLRGELLPGRVITDEGLYFRSQPGFLVMQDFDGGAFHDAKRPITREHVEATLRRISGADVAVDAVHAATTWTDRARQATRYRDGRILLAGDAAHVHAPLGGQGLNLGLGDAADLGWKLAAAVHGDPGPLDTYEAVRHPIAARVLDWSRAQVVLMRPDARSRALRAIVQDLLATPDGATYVAGRIWGVQPASM